MENLFIESKRMTTELRALRRALHENAEVGFDLKNTLAIVFKALTEMGYDPQPCGRAGIVASVGKGEKVFLLRADMDGLPMTEKSGLSYCAKNGNMHACGHDMHTAMLLGAAKLLKGRENALCGQVKLLFQPAEEVLEGAKEMIAAGVLDNPKPQAGMMIHVMTAVDIPVGGAVIADGVSAPAADFFRIKVQGKGCHGSAPWKGIDALSVSARIALGLQEIPAREIALSSPAVLTVGSLNAGNAGNVIADDGVLKGTLRAFDEDTRLQVKKRIKEVAKGIGTAFRARVKVDFEGGCPTLVNDEKLGILAEKTAKKILKSDLVFHSATLREGRKREGGGAEDFAYISHEIPTVMIGLAAGEKGKGYLYPLHHPKARFDEEALPFGAALFAGVAMEYLKKQGTIFAVIA